jgi:hypothetical protein
MSQQDTARRALVAKTVADEIKKVGDAAKADLLAIMEDGGTERIRVTDDQGEDFGTVTRSPGRTLARIIDPEAFLIWVEQRYPDQIVRSVNPAFVDRLLAGAVRRGDPVDEQGEEMPGVQIGVGQAYLTVRPTPAARKQAAQILAGHKLEITSE